MIELRFIELYNNKNNVFIIKLLFYNIKLHKKRVYFLNE